MFIIGEDYGESVDVSSKEEEMVMLFPHIFLLGILSFVSHHGVIT
jgi:hypothetical protein